MTLISRRDLIVGACAAPTAGLMHNSVLGAVSKKLADFGWSVEGQGVNAPVAPSVYGAGAGMKYFGLKKAVFMFHPNNDLAMEKLRHCDDIVCDITKWKQTACSTPPDPPGYNCVQLHYDLRPATMLAEAQTVSRLASKYKNVKGAYVDDVLRNITYASVPPQKRYATVQKALQKDNSSLKLWTPVSPEQVIDGRSTEFKTHVDVINLKMVSAKDVANLDRVVDLGQKLFPGKSIVLTCSLWDYTSKNPMPLSVLKRQWNRVLDHVQDGSISGYVIFASFLIDSVQEQARWVRDFIAAN
jgi:hypothetical protein